MFDKEEGQVEEIYLPSSKFVIVDILSPSSQLLVSERIHGFIIITCGRHLSQFIVHVLYINNVTGIFLNPIGFFSFFIFQPNLTVWKRTCVCVEFRQTFRTKWLNGSITCGSHKSRRTKKRQSAVYQVKARRRKTTKQKKKICSIFNVFSFLFQISWKARSPSTFIWIL